jgi:hypothetical protein
LNYKSKLAITVAALALSFAASAQTKPVEPGAGAKPGIAPAVKPAEGPGPRMGGIPEKITRAEAIQRATEQFDMVDTNKDGTVTKEEIQAFQTKMREAMQGGVMGKPAGGPDGKPAGGPGMRGEKPVGAPPVGEHTRPMHPAEKAPAK